MRLRKTEDKKTISQRWDLSFYENVKQLSSDTDYSMTELTIEGLTILMHLFENSKFRKMRSQERIEKVKSIIDNPREIDLQWEGDLSNRPPGFIIDIIKEMLIQNEGVKYTSTEIARNLSIPQSTVRAYIRKISKSDSNFQLIEGKPNNIVFKLSG